MTQAAFVRARQQGWRDLESLLAVADRRGLRGLAPEEVARLGHLYRWATSDVAYAQGRRYDAGLCAYLNRLTARAHAYVYSGAAQSTWSRIAQFYARDFPAEVRRSKWFVLGCMAVFVAAGLASYALITQRPVNAYAVLPAEAIRPIHRSLHDSNFAFDRDYSAHVSALIIQNNIRLAVMAFAGGVTLGAVTAYITIFNGLYVGATAALYANAGFGYDFWATVSPHGWIELSAFQIAAAAGLIVAAAILAPGRLRRSEALRRNGRRAGVLVLGVASMLLVAGLIEGFFSPQRYAPEARIAFGVATAIFALAYFVLAGRGGRRHAGST